MKGLYISLFDAFFYSNYFCSQKKAKNKKLFLKKWRFLVKLLFISIKL